VELGLDVLPNLPLDGGGRVLQQATGTTDTVEPLGALAPMRVLSASVHEPF